MCSKVVETVEAKCGTEAQLRSEGRVVSKFWEVCLSLVSISIMVGHGPFPGADPQHASLVPLAA